MKSHRRNKLLPRWAFALAAIKAVGGLAAGVGIMGDAQTKVQEPVTVEGGDITKVLPTLVVLDGDGDTVDEAVPVAFYEAFYDADLNGDGDSDDLLVSAAFYEPAYDTDLNQDVDEEDAVTDPADEMIAILLLPVDEFIIYNDNLSFIATDKVAPGERFMVRTNLKNHSEVDQKFRITMDAPDGFRFIADHDPDRDDVSNVTQEGTHSATFVLDADAEGDRFDLELQIEALPQVVPGWYEIHFETEPLPSDPSNL